MTSSLMPAFFLTLTGWSHQIFDVTFGLNLDCDRGDGFGLYAVLQLF